MAEPTNYPGITGVGMSITFTPTGEGAVAIPILDILDMSPPTRKYGTAPYVPQSGDLAGKEQFAVGSQKLSQCSVTVVYSKQQYAAIEAQAGKAGCAVVFALPDGASFNGTGALIENAVQQITDDKVITANLVFMIAGDWVFDDGVES